MQLKEFKVTHYKSIEDSGTVSVGDVTCLVGKNESGKTAILEALGRLHAAGSLSKNFSLDEYPRHGLLAYKKVHADEPAPVIEATFELSDEEFAHLESKFGQGTLKSREVAIEKRYDNVRYFSIQTDEERYVRHLLENTSLPGNVTGELSKSKNFRSLLAALRSLDSNQKAVQDFHFDMESLHDKPLVKRVIQELNIPEFFYFDDYSLIPGTISINEIKAYTEREGEDHNPRLRTALLLLNKIGATPEDFQEVDRFSELQMELEGVSNLITDQIFEFWSQSQDLEVEIGLQPVFNRARILEDTLLTLKIKDVRQRISIPFDRRSRGFVWLFSFLVAFSEFAEKKRDVILLLDEPGQHLHPKGQSDLLRFFESVIAPKHQLIYTTHSPFLLDSSHMDRLRVVLDGGEEGTSVAADLSQASGDALQPVKAALGFELVESLVSGGPTLFVSEAAVTMYLAMISDRLAKDEKAHLNPAWNLVPSGQLSSIAAFVALSKGSDTPMAILAEGEAEEVSKIQSLLDPKGDDAPQFITVSDSTKAMPGTVEDLFDRAEYMKLVEAAYKNEIKDRDFDADKLAKGKDPVVPLLREHFNISGIGDGTFDRMRVAMQLCTSSANAQKSLFKADTLKKFEALFEKITQALTED